MSNKDIIAQYVKERDEMLLKCDVNELMNVHALIWRLLEGEEE